MTTADIAQLATEHRWAVCPADVATSISGWITPGGELFLSTDNRKVPHENVSKILVRFLGLPTLGWSQTRLIEAGWIRKASPCEFEFTFPEALRAVEMDIIRNGNYARELRLDVHYRGTKVPMTIGAGWEHLEKAIRKFLR